LGPFADYLSLTTPIESTDAVVSDIMPVLDAAGGSVEFGDEFSSTIRVGPTGTVVLKRRHGVFCVSASGDALGTLRTSSLFGEYLAALSPHPHRVTRLDATLDVVADAPVLIRSLWRLASAGRIALSHKRVPGVNCSKFISPGAIDGRDTGSIYIGSKTAEIRAAVYDKRNKLFVDTGSDVGPLTRYEMRYKSGVGCTLADAWDPTGVFWHYAAPGLLVRPDGVQPWVPHAEGFEMSERQTFTAAELMDRKLDGSSDVRRLLELAEQVGPLGLDLLCQRLRRMAAQGASSTQGRPRGAEAVFGRPTPLQ